MAQNSSKVKPSLDEVLLLIEALCINSNRSSSLRFSCNCLEMALNSSKSMIPFSSLSKMAKTRRIPSLVLVSPTLEQMMSKNSGKAIGLFFSLSPKIRVRMKGFLLSRPSSSRTLLISSGSMVPLPSSSKMSKVFLSSSKSSAVILSFQEAEGAGLAAWAGCAVVLAVLLIRYFNKLS